MAVIEKGIVANENGTISFGNHEVLEKFKLRDFVLDGNSYNIKTHKDVTRLTKNGILLFESVPGCTVHNFSLSEKKVTFTVEGNGDTQVTLELLPSTEYKITLDDFIAGSSTSNISGKLSLNVSLTNGVGNVKLTAK